MQHHNNSGHLKESIELLDRMRQQLGRNTVPQYSGETEGAPCYGERYMEGPWYALSRSCDIRAKFVELHFLKQPEQRAIRTWRCIAAQRHRDLLILRRCFAHLGFRTDWFSLSDAKAWARVNALRSRLDYHNIRRWAMRDTPPMHLGSPERLLQVPREELERRYREAMRAVAGYKSRAVCASLDLTSVKVSIRVSVKVRTLFNEMDKNGHGAMSRTELVIALRQLPDAATILELPQSGQDGAEHTTAESFFQKLEANDDKEISFEELMWDLHITRMTDKELVEALCHVERLAEERKAELAIKEYMEHRAEIKAKWRAALSAYKAASPQTQPRTPNPASLFTMRRCHRGQCGAATTAQRGHVAYLGVCSAASLVP